MLTKKQKALLLFIHERLQEDDVPPSFEEMKEALALKSKSGVHRLITGLEERGYIERLPHRARALEIKKLPEGFQKKEMAPIGLVAAAAVQASAASIPLYGKIAAGTPIDAIANEQDMVEVPPSMLGMGGDRYALTVEGDSMIKAGIFDSDTVIIERCSTAQNGEIIVALVDGQEATLKRLRRAGAKIVLEPENDEYEPQILEPHRVQIQGKLAGLLRNYH